MSTEALSTRISLNHSNLTIHQAIRLGIGLGLAAPLAIILYESNVSPDQAVLNYGNRVGAYSEVVYANSEYRNAHSMAQLSSQDHGNEKDQLLLGNLDLSGTYFGTWNGQEIATINQIFLRTQHLLLSMGVPDDLVYKKHIRILKGDPNQASNTLGDEIILSPKDIDKAGAHEILHTYFSGTAPLLDEGLAEYIQIIINISRRIDVRDDLLSLKSCMELKRAAPDTYYTTVGYTVKKLNENPGSPIKGFVPYLLTMAGQWTISYEASIPVEVIRQWIHDKYGDQGVRELERMGFLGC